MKSRSKGNWAIRLSLAAIAVVGITAAAAHAFQDVAKPARATYAQPRAPITYAKPPSVVTSFPTTRYTVQTRGQKVSEQQKLSKSLAPLMNVLRDDPTDEQRKEAIDKAEELFADFFDNDLSRRKKELETLEERTQKTADRLAKRLEAKSELIELQMKSYEYEAEGLGLLSDQPKRANNPFNLAYSASTLANSGPRNYYGSYASSQKKKDPLAEARKGVSLAFAKFRKDEDKEKAEVELRKSLDTYFDKDMEIRKSELDKIQEGLTKLKKSIEKRAKAKDDIVKLQLKLMQNRAEGLEFFRTDGQRAGSQIPFVY